MASTLTGISLNQSSGTPGWMPVFKPDAGWVVDFSGTMSLTGASSADVSASLYSALNSGLTWNILTDADRNGASEFGPLITQSSLAASSGNVQFSPLTTTTGSFASVNASVNFTVEEKLGDIRSALLTSAQQFGISAADITGIRLNVGLPGAVPITAVNILSPDQFNSAGGDLTSPLIVRSPSNSMGGRSEEHTSELQSH